MKTIHKLLSIAVFAGAVFSNAAAHAQTDTRIVVKTQDGQSVGCGIKKINSAAKIGTGESSSVHPTILVSGFIIHSPLSR